MEYSPVGRSGTAGNGFTNYQQYNLLAGVPHACLLSVTRKGELKPASKFVTSGAVTFRADILTASDSLSVTDDAGENIVLTKGTRLVVLTVNDFDPSNNSGEWKHTGLPADSRRYLMKVGNLGLLE